MHPGKSKDDAEKVPKALEAVDKARKSLLDREQKKRALDVIEGGKEYVEHIVKEQKKTSKEGRKSYQYRES